MGYRGDERQSGDRWRDRDQDYRAGDYGRDHGRDYGREQGRGGYGGGGGDDRGFFDRAGDEVRSWFGDDEAQRRREADQRRWEQEQRMSGRRDNDGGRYESGPGSFGGGGFGTGWGNQHGDSWNRERPGERGGGSGGEREGWFSDSVGGERGRRYGGGGGAGYGSGYGVGTPELFGGSGYGGDHDRGRRFDRVDAGSTGTHGAHPMSAPTGGGFGGGYGPESHGSGSASRYAAIRDQGGQRGGDLHDPHYQQWRQRQIEDLDRDYDEYRREHQSKFETEFGNWRSKRQGQRQSLNKVAPHMEVVGSDGSHVGTVDKVAGDRIVLTRSDENAGGVHHWVPCGWVETVDERVTLNRTSEQAMDEWRSEERSRALFEREESGSDGPRMLDRSFSGTYGDRDRDRDNGGGDS
ncbi:MAG TPA: DUF2171 domain-containing protein [Allosphingosinicella sp.]|jgi:hypothetical protein